MRLVIVVLLTSLLFLILINPKFVNAACYSIFTQIKDCSVANQCFCGGLWCEGYAKCENGQSISTTCGCTSGQEANDCACGSIPNACITNKGACAPKNPPYEVWRLVEKGWGQPSEPDACEKYGAGLGQGGACGCNLRPNYAGRCTIDWTGGVGNCNNFHCNYEVNDACSCGSQDTSGGGGCSGADATSCGGLFGGNSCKWYKSIQDPAPECGPGASCNVQTGNCGTGNCLDVCGQWLDGGCGITCKEKSCVVTNISVGGVSQTTIPQEIQTRIDFTSTSSIIELARLLIENTSGTAINPVPLGSSVDSSFSKTAYVLTSCNRSIAGGSCAGTAYVNDIPALPIGNYYAHCDIPSTAVNQPCTGSPFCNANYTGQQTCTGWKSCDAKLNTEPQDDSKAFTITAVPTPQQPGCTATPSTNLITSGVTTTLTTSVTKNNTASFDPSVNNVTYLLYGSFPTSLSYQTAPNYPYGYTSGSGVITANAFLNTMDLSKMPLVLTNYWSMDETSGSKIYDYVSANNGNGTATNVSGTNTNAKVGNARSFNGTGGFIRLNQPVTRQYLNMWFRTTNNAAEQIIWYSGYAGCYIEIGTTNTGTVFLRGNGTAGGSCPAVNGAVTSTVTTGTLSNNGTWHSIQFFYEGGASHKLCYDGASCWTFNMWGSVQPGTTAIGARPDATGSFNGQIDEIGAWSSGLTAANISTLHSSYTFNNATQVTVGASGFKSCQAIVNVSSGAWWQVRGGSIFAPSINNSNIPANTYMILPKTL